MLKDFTLSLELEPTENRVVQTAAIFWSHDVNTAKIYIELLRKGTPIILNKDVTVRVMMLFDDENKSEHIYTAKIEDELKGLVSITLEESMRMYVGQVTCGVYVDYQNEEKTDNGYFTFGMRRSLIDKDMPELKKMYVSDFEDALKGIEELKEGIDKNVDNMKERIEVIEKLIKNNEVATKNELGILEDFREFESDVITKMKNEFTERGLNPKWFGAKGDGKTDDTESLQLCIDYAAKNNHKVYIPKGVFLVKAHVGTPKNTTDYLMNEGGIKLTDNSIIEFSRDGILKPIQHDKKASNVLRTYNNKNIRLINPRIEDNYSGGKEWNYGIAIQGGEDIVIVNPKIHGFSGDGINIQRSNLTNEEMYIPKNIKIYNGDLTKNGRQSISIEEVDGILVDGTLVGHSDKNLPMSAIDIEPAWVQPQDKTVCQNIQLKNLEFSNNQYNGFQIIGSHYVKNVLVENCVFAKNNLSGKNDVTNKIGNCQNVAFKNCVFDEGEKIQFSGVKNIEFSDTTFKDSFLDIKQTTNNLIVNSAIFTYTKLKKGMQPISVHKGAATVCDFTIKNSTIDLGDNGISNPEYGILALVTIKGMTNFMSVNNVYRNAGRAVDNAFYNDDALALQFTSINDTFENIRQQAIITTAHEVKVVKPTFLGIGYATAKENGFSRDIQWNMQSNAKKLILSQAYGDKRPTNPNINFVDLGNSNENIMLHITGDVATAEVTGGNNVCDYLIQNKYQTGDTINSVSSTSGKIVTIHKPLTDYSRFSPSTIILILEGNIFGYINENFKFIELSKK